MNNLSDANVSQASWVHLLGLCPLVAIGLTISDALLFSAALLITLISTNASMALLQRWITEAYRLITTALVATIFVGAIDLVLQAICYERAQRLENFLLLIVVVPLLLYKANPVDAPILRRSLLDALLCGSAFAASLVIVAILRAPLPSEAGIALSFIISGLLLATANKLFPQRIDNSTPPGTPRIRARVTGPVR